MCLERPNGVFRSVIYLKPKLSIAWAIIIMGACTFQNFIAKFEVVLRTSDFKELGYRPSQGKGNMHLVNI